MENVLRTVLNAGLEKPVFVLHVTDIHLTESLPEDPEDLRARLADRRELFKKLGNFPPHTPNEYFEEAIRLSESEQMPLVVTGDVMDLNSAGNRAEFHRIIKGHDLLYCPGGHEFQKRCRRPMEEDPPYYENARRQVEAAFPEFSFTFQSRIVGGVNLIAIDNGQDYFPAKAYDALLSEAKRGLPMVLFMHDPLNDDGLLRRRAPHPNVGLTEEDYRVSDEMYRFITSSPLVLAVIAGHSHVEESFTVGSTPCFVTPGLFSGTCRIVEIC